VVCVCLCDYVCLCGVCMCLCGVCVCVCGVYVCGVCSGAVIISPKHLSRKPGPVMTYTHTNNNSTKLVACTQQWDVQILSLLLDRRKGGVHLVPKVPGAMQQQALHSLLLPFI
jgi:hypothetical protein